MRKLSAAEKPEAVVVRAGFKCVRAIPSRKRPGSGKITSNSQGPRVNQVSGAAMVVNSRSVAWTSMIRWARRAAALLVLAGFASAHAQSAPSFTVQWNSPGIASHSTPTFQVVVNPMLRPGSPLSGSAFAAIKAMGADDVRFVPWLPYPKLSVAELQPPSPGGTSWNFTLIDPIVKPFLDNTAGHGTVMNFSTIPAWLFQTPKPVTYPADPNQVDWHYTQGTELRDPSGKELGDYYERLVSWYTRGGFTDEDGRTHTSGYHYSFPIWEVLNEVDFEHNTTPEQYTRRYDAIVSAIHAVSPQTKFMGLALATPSDHPEFFTYFLDHAHHRPGIPLDYISYHFYATPTPDETIEDWQYSFFAQADGFLATVRYIEQIRKRLSPETKTDTDELGVILPTDNTPHDAQVAIPSRYWNLAGALYAYLYMELAQQQIDVIGESQLVGYPSQFPSVTMMDWKDGKPNARYWVLKLIRENFHPGDTLVHTTPADAALAVQAFETPAGRKLLLVNKRNRAMDVTLPGGAAVAQMAVVDEASGAGPAVVSHPAGTVLHLAPFAVAVATLR